MCPFSIAMLVYRIVTGMILQVLESPPPGPTPFDIPRDVPTICHEGRRERGS